MTPIKDPYSHESDGNQLYSDPSLTAICPGSETVFFAAQGIVKEFTKDIKFKQQFTAAEQGWTITRLQYLHGTSFLLTVAEMQGKPLTVHLWDLEKQNGGTSQAPHCHTTVHVTNGSNTFPLSAFAISSDYSVLGFGYADGSVIVVRGDILRDRGSRQRVVYNSPSPITGLEIHESSDGQTVTLFVTSVNQVFTVPTNGRNPGKAETMLEKNRGAAVGCVSKVKHKHDGECLLVVARDDGVTYYSNKLRQSSFVFDLPKKSVYLYKQYLVITTSGGGNNSNTAAINSVVNSSTIRIVIIDTLNKYIAFNGQIAQGVKDVFILWDRINVVGSDGVLYSIEEKDLTSRLNILKQRNLYPVAIQLVGSLNAGKKLTSQLENEYAEYLYNEGDLNEALTHFINGIGYGQTSQVILKYRDSQYIENLTRYLEELHKQGLATKEHTTLLMNSYAKLKDDEKLKQFIVDGSDNKKFDFETAIKICRQAGYYSLATYLAETTGDSDLAVQIKLRDLEDYRGCLEYVQTLEVKDTLRILIQHSRLLLDRYPMETTGLLINLFTGKYIPKPRDPIIKNDEEEEEQRTAGTTTENITAPVIQSYRAFLNYMSNGFGTGLVNGTSETSALQTVDPSTSFDEESASRDSNSEVFRQQQQQNQRQQIPSYQPPRPRLIFSAFLEHPNEFVIFLEACIESYDEFEGNEKDRVDLLSTLFEIYLTIANRCEKESEKKQWHKKAKDLSITLEDKIDRNSMLLTSYMASYHDNELLAKNQEGFQIDLFRACVANRDVKGAIEIVHKYGDQEKELFPLALSFFTSSESILDEVGEEFNFVLDRIRKDKLMAPLQVIQALSSNSVATVGHVRDYLLELISSEREEVEKNNKLAQSYQNEITSKKEEIEKLENDPQVVQYTLCASCNKPLDLPAVHFACKHSYHKRCLEVIEPVLRDEGNGHGADAGYTSDGPKCPRCIQGLEDIQTVRKGQQDMAERNDLFISTLKESDDKFKVITDFFGRGALTL